MYSFSFNVFSLFSIHLSCQSWSSARPLSMFNVCGTCTVPVPLLEYVLTYSFSLFHYIYRLNWKKKSRKTKQYKIHEYLNQINLMVHCTTSSVCTVHTFNHRVLIFFFASLTTIKKSDFHLAELKTRIEIRMIVKFIVAYSCLYTCRLKYMNYWERKWAIFFKWNYKIVLLW